MREVSENLATTAEASARSVGAPVTVTDPDNDTLKYALGGDDAAAFDLDASTGQLRTKASVIGLDVDVHRIMPMQHRIRRVR